MMLGKRPRHPMKRTTSMTDFSSDDLTAIQSQPSDHHHHHHHEILNQRPRNTNIISRRNSADWAPLQQPQPSFLNCCSLCNRRLPPGRDIFMYRGDSAFCSQECRQQQMTQDEWKEKKKSINNNNNNKSHSDTNGSNKSNIVVSSTQAGSIAAL